MFCVYTNLHAEQCDKYSVNIDAVVAVVINCHRFILQYNATVDQQFRGQISQTMDERCSENKVACGLASKRRRYARRRFTYSAVSK